VTERGFNLINSARRLESERGHVAIRRGAAYKYGPTMIARSALELHPRARAVMATLLLVLVSLAVPLEASQPLHVHEAGTAGLYNEEHVLVALDSLSGDLPLPDAGPAVFVALVAGARLLARGVRLSAPLLSLSDSRAPPVA